MNIFKRSNEKQTVEHFIFGSECLYNKQEKSTLKQPITNIYEGYFVLQKESRSVGGSTHGSEGFTDEEIVKMIKLYDNVVRMSNVQNTIHPFFGEVTLSTGSFEGVPFGFAGKIEFVVLKEEELRRICYVNHQAGNSDEKENFIDLEWHIHDDISHRGWNLEKKGNRLEFSHSGRDEFWVNELLKDVFIEDVEPIVQNCIDSNNQLISTLGAYNLQNILSYLPFNDLNNCYKSFRMMRDLISSRDFLYKLIESQCITLPEMYYQKSRRNLKHCSILDLLQLYHERRDKYSMGKRYEGSYVIWLNEVYWRTNQTKESEFGTNIKLDSVWWFDFGASICLKRGCYDISLRYRTSKYGNGLDNLNVTGNCIAGVMETSSIVSVCVFSSPQFSDVHLGQVSVGSERGILSLTIYDHRNTYKAGLEIDCIQFKRI